MLRDLVCPVSSERTDARVVRLVAGAVALLTTGFLLTRWIAIPVVLLADFVIRGFTSGRRSPLRAAAAAALGGRGAPRMIDRAPKIFAARVGVIFTFGILVALGVAPLGAQVLAGILVGFALLEAVFDVCVGCLVYSYVVVRAFRGG